MTPSSPLIRHEKPYPAYGRPRRGAGDRPVGTRYENHIDVSWPFRRKRRDCAITHARLTNNRGWSHNAREHWFKSDSPTRFAYVRKRISLVSFTYNIDATCYPSSDRANDVALEWSWAARQSELRPIVSLRRSLTRTPQGCSQWYVYWLTAFTSSLKHVRTLTINTASGGKQTKSSYVHHVSYLYKNKNLINSDVKWFAKLFDRISREDVPRFRQSGRRIYSLKKSHLFLRMIKKYSRRLLYVCTYSSSFAAIFFCYLPRMWR